MPLTPGARLGPYEVVSALGAGGMGEVYKARDTRLDRTVAIKLLPSEIAGDPDLRARFEREARAVAAPDHPHICGIYDVGSVDGIHYLVMPHLEGQTLAAQLEKGPLPLDQALKIAIEIADALVGAVLSRAACYWSTDGQVVFYQATMDAGYGIWTSSVERKNPKVILDTSSNEVQAAVSADGRRMAYASDQRVATRYTCKISRPAGSERSSPPTAACNRSGEKMVASSTTFNQTVR